MASFTRLVSGLRLHLREKHSRVVFDQMRRMSACPRCVADVDARCTLGARAFVFLAPRRSQTTTRGGVHISVEPRINERIRVPHVRLVGPNGEQVGIVGVEEALRLAQGADLDLVEVAPDANPPVCKIMDYGKFKYEAAVKAREARKNQVNTVIKEMKLRPKIDTHDYETKKGHIQRFLAAGDKVKVTIMFRGREQARPEMGHRLLMKLAEDIVDLGVVEAAPRLDGRNMTMVIAPVRRKAEARAAARREEAAAQRDVTADETQLDVTTTTAGVVTGADEQ